MPLMERANPGSGRVIHNGILFTIYQEVWVLTFYFILNSIERWFRMSLVIYFLLLVQSNSPKKSHKIGVRLLSIYDNLFSIIGSIHSPPHRDLMALLQTVPSILLTGICSGHFVPKMASAINLAAQLWESQVQHDLQVVRVRKLGKVMPHLWNQWLKSPLFQRLTYPCQD
jgi:hypothetical protein